MKKLICALALSSLSSIGLFVLTFETIAQPIRRVEMEKPSSTVISVYKNEASQPASSVSIAEVLLAHRIPQNPDALSNFEAAAVRLTSRPRGTDHDMPNFFERNVSVVVAGNAYKRHTADSLKLREQFDLFDGTTPYHSVIEDGRLVEEANPITQSQAKGVSFSVRTFTLVPILKQLSDPATEAVYLGRTVYGEDKFDVKTATDKWTIYTDAEHLICRLDMRDKSIEYASYRSVAGIRLPFIQRLSINGSLIQETIFSRITINPKLPDNFFSREALLKNIAR
jgi:hypothetical protein